jgi:hypothetical protein
MKDLGSNARELLDAAAKADCGPAAHLRYGRGRLVATLAAGTITTSAIVTKGAVLGASGAATGAPATVASLVTTLVSAVTIGLSTGLVVMSPATRIKEPSRVDQRAVMADASARMAPHPAVSSGPQRALPTAPEPTAPVEESPAAVAPSPSSGAVVAPSKPTRSSIAQETALLAEVQRALKAGRAAVALVVLDRYAEQCPGGLLQEEATVSRVLALCALGRVQDARRWADEFSRRYPDSPLLPRVGNACSAANQRSADPESAND